MIKSYLYSLFVGLLFVSSVFAEACNVESGECGDKATTPSFYRAVKAESYVAGFGCSSSIDITMVPGSGRFIVVDGVNRPAADYQVSVRNTASCVIYAADVQITPPSGGFVLSTTNLNSNGTEGSYNLVISQFGGSSLPPGSTYTNASVTAYFLSSGVAPSLDASIVPKCPANCIVQGTTSAGCQARTSVTIRGSASVNSAGKYEAQYDVLIVNIGSCGIYEVGLDFSLPPGITITQTTGLVQTYGVGQYKATGFTNNRDRLMQGDTLASEDSYTASLTAEFDSSAAVLQKFTVDSTSFCGSSCSESLATPAPANNQCAAIVTAVWIPGSPRSPVIDGVNRIVADYQIQVANFGQCSISSVTFVFAPYSGSYLTNATNLQSTGQTNEYRITQQLATPGAVYTGATITGVYAATGFAYQIPLSSVTPQCDGCGRTTDSPTSAPSGCSATATAVLRTTWKSGSTENRLYDFVITNTGSSVAQSVDLSLGFSTASEVTQSWNVEKVSSSVYRANLYAAAPNAVVRSSGYVLTIQEAAFASGSFTDPTVTVSSTQC